MSVGPPRRAGSVSGLPHGHRATDGTCTRDLRLDGPALPLAELRRHAKKRWDQTGAVEFTSARRGCRYRQAPVVPALPHDRGSCRVCTRARRSSTGTDPGALVRRCGCVPWEQRLCASRRGTSTGFRAACASHRDDAFSTTGSHGRCRCGHRCCSSRWRRAPATSTARRRGTAACRHRARWVRS